jgi:Fe-S-cluster containining protein
MDNGFNCTLCGECCSGEMKVFVNPRDMALLCEYFSCPPEELTSRGYLIGDRRNGAVLPRIKFREFSGVKFCPFLENRLEDDGSLKGLCRLHPHFKPLVCHLAPLSRTVDFSDDSENYSFIPPHPACPGCGSVGPDREKLDYGNLSDGIKERLAEEKEYFRTLWLALED